jgi:hypothetical protein
MRATRTLGLDHVLGFVRATVTRRSDSQLVPCMPSRRDNTVRSSYMADQKDGRSQNQPSHDAQVKGGQHSHGGNEAEKSQPDQSQNKQRQPDRGAVRSDPRLLAISDGRLPSGQIFDAFGSPKTQSKQATKQQWKRLLSRLHRGSREPSNKALQTRQVRNSPGRPRQHRCSQTSDHGGCHPSLSGLSFPFHGLG